MLKANFRQLFFKWGGPGGVGAWLLSELAPEIIPAPFRLVLLAGGALWFLIWLGDKEFKWLKTNTMATTYESIAILALQFGALVLPLAWIASVIEFEHKPTAREIAVEQGGGDNYCFFVADFGRPQTGGGYEWQLQNKEQRPIPNVRMCRYLVVDGKEEYRGCSSTETCIPHSIDQTTAGQGPIRQGVHRFRFFSANSWEQTLEISGGNEPTQLGIIYRNGTEVWRFSYGAR